MTFDDRKLLSAKTRRNENGPNMTRSQTFVSKSRVAATQPATLSDVMFRKHFGNEDTPNQPVGATTAPLFMEELPVQASTGKAVVVVDTFSTGFMLAYQAFVKGYQIICVYSADLGDLANLVPEGLEFSFAGTFTLDAEVGENEALLKLVREVHSLGLPVEAVFAGAETGVELADELSSHMGLLTNGTAQSEARRNKFIMGETVHQAGIRSVRQLVATTWEQISDFLDEWQPDPYKVIVKPNDSAGSDDVTLCLSLIDVKNAFGHIMGKVNGLGLVNKAVLVQEYLEGTEYVVDMVSLNGHHKLIGVWEYDRYPANGAGFVCHGQKLLTANDERIPEILAYQRQVITALGVKNGPTHGEVKWFNGSPCLVEVGARCHGGEGLWVDVANEAMGYNQVNATVNAYLDEEAFAALPDECFDRIKFGSLKYLISFQEGVVKEIRPAVLAEISAMESYRGHQMFVKEGNKVHKTISCFTWTGCVRLVHEDEQQLNRDYKRLEELQLELFVLEEDLSTVPAEPTEAVVVVDPFSTGACLASHCYSMGYKVIAVYSAHLEELAGLASLIPQGQVLEFHSIVPFEEDIGEVVRKIETCGFSIVACMAGAETGVELADELSSHMGLLTNGTAQSEARRNKFIMGETVNKAGLRSVRQLVATTWEQISDFLQELQPNPFQVIVKPNDSAGSDDVTLCLSPIEVETTFAHIMGKVNERGLVNKAVLVQEHLDGTEYVVDMVSLKGNHKVTAVWECDKGPCDGANFVMLGMRPLQSTNENVSEIIAYQKQVITALGVQNGPSHGVVKWHKGSPYLLEASACCHGGEGLWTPVANSVYGYNQVDVAAAAYVESPLFDLYPTEPPAAQGSGRVLYLLVKAEGTLFEINPSLIEEMRSLPSFGRCEVYVKLGSQVVHTLNGFSFGGVVVLKHAEQEIVDADSARIRQMEDEGLFVLE